MNILIMGLPGAGKTTLARLLRDRIPECALFDADEIREIVGDWSFDYHGRIRQAQRMTSYAQFEKLIGRNSICSFVAPYNMSRKIFNADVNIWIDTIEKSVYDDTNNIFEPPDTEKMIYITTWKYNPDEIIKRIMNGEREFTVT